MLYGLVTLTEARIPLRKKYNAVDKDILPLLPDSSATIDELYKSDAAAANIFRYITKKTSLPVFNNSDIEFFAEASDCYEVQKEACRNAKKFIFLEYFAIEDTQSFEPLKDILIQKVKEGVEVRIIFDEVGSVAYISRNFIKQMESYGIKCRAFNPMIPIFYVFMDHRDHRKISVIDGEISFTGGYNLADEYFNITHPRGYWKDTGVKITGPATNALCALFLETWNATKKRKEPFDDYSKYIVKKNYVQKENSFIQPYADTPMDNIHVGEDVYLNIINAAQKYVYISSPYLIVMDEMKKALCLAADRGVDVRIVTPGIPDKKFAYKCTRSTYTRLVNHGIEIYEFTPGFNHAKQMVSDDKIATCGTVNFDYRSFYHNFENGVLIYNSKAVTDIKTDFENMFPQSRNVTELYKNKNSFLYRMYVGIIRLFAPLM